MKSSPIIPFNLFKESLPGVTFKKLALDNNFSALKSTGFVKMRNYLVNYYDGIEAVHSFKDQEGQVWDCVPINLQPALKNIKTPLADPPDLSAEVDLPEFNKLTSFLEEGLTDDEGNAMHCPPGNVPIRRITLEDIVRFKNLEEFRQKAPRFTKNEQEVLEQEDVYIHKYAHAYQQVKNLGGASIMSIWRPVVKSSQTFSLCQHWFVAGPDNTVQTIEAGWQVYPQRYGTIAPCLFIYWTADGYNKTGAYNNEDHAFHQVSNKWAIGAPLKSTDQSDNKPVELIIAWRLINGNWWLYINGLSSADAVGYYPASLYGHGPLSQNAASIDYGGEVVGNTTWPQMGNGQFGDQPGHAAYQRNIAFFDLNGNLKDANLNQAEPSPECFKAKIERSDSWRETLFYGGPGGSGCEPKIIA